ncbi:MAG: hypothetical protein JWN98_2731 [Abditibacteriota bacterium]|nr:hypothetical protein [Abditibacteriota bacterium]
MAEFVSFRGLRYNCDKVKLSDVLAPPYDVIKGAMRDDLLARNPHNIVQVELAAPYGEDATPEQYQKCAEILKEWRSQEILIRDNPAFYLYEQEFAVPGRDEVRKRRGVLGALLLEEFGEGVQPHEHTLSGPKQDRLNLLRATRTNTSPIFGLYNDNDGWVTKLLEDVAFDAPLCEARDSEGVVHRLWRITDDETVNALDAALENESILIADGHHRYETALNYRNEQRAQAEKEGRTWTGDEDENFVLMMCVSTSDDGLVVLPTHRLVKGPTNVLMQALSKYFDVEPALAGDAEALVQSLDDPQFTKSPGRLGLHLPGQSFVLQLKPGTAHRQAMEDGKSEAYNDLDVSILHTLILQRELNIGPQELAAGGHVSYTIDAAEAIAKVESGAYNAAFLMRSTPVEQVQSVAAAGDKMPQKSTYFFPKLITGMVLRPID